MSPTPRTIRPNAIASWPISLLGSPGPPLRTTGGCEGGEVVSGFEALSQPWVWGEVHPDRGRSPMHGEREGVSPWKTLLLFPS